MFNWSYKDNFIFKIFNDEGGIIPTSEWSKQENKYLSQISILKEFVDNGFGDFKDTNCVIEANEILKLNEIDQQILDLPSHYPYEVLISSKGQLNEPTFLFAYEFYDFTPNGNLLNSKRNGPFVEVDQRQYLLSTNQYLLCNAIDEFNQLDSKEKSFNNNLIQFAEIKKLSQESASILDLYLNSQNVLHPDKIRVALNYMNGTLEITPTIDNVNPATLNSVIQTLPTVRDNYPINDGEGRTTRIVLNDDQKAELKKIKSVYKVSDKEKIDAIVEHPENFFDDEIIDISVFYSDRVKDIGVYKPKFYPFICPYKSEWIPGIVIKDRIDGEKRVHIKSEVDLKEFENCIIECETKSDSNVKWRDIELPLSNARYIYSIAERQIHKPRKPIFTKEEAAFEDVLIIKENADILEYSQTIVPTTEIVHNFYSIANLIPTIHLKSHQIEGIAWLQSLIKDYPGCLLADDMGLGKTLQLLYFIEWHAQFYNTSKPYLIVAPVSLLENWQNEYFRFFSPRNLNLVFLYGNVSLTKHYSKESNEFLNKKQLILTNYETVKSYQFNICAVDYSIVVLDEAQKIKTPGTLITNVTKALKSDFKVAMTGTPVENTLVDIWSIIDFSLPGLLGNAKEFTKEFQHPLKKENVDLVHLANKLRDRIGVFIKRRLKKDVLSELPPKYDDEKSKIKKLMPPKQLERYLIEIESAKNIGLSEINGRNQILKSLWNIRDISDHPYLADSQIYNYTSTELIESSAKLQITVDILNKVKAKNEKVIVFADRRETQKMIQKVVADIFGLYPSIINGDTPTLQKSFKKSKLSRQQTIDYFQSKDGFNIIIMSQLAAGIGLNVTEANHVIHFSRHWNPAKENQATDRVHRIGQVKAVYVYYPMAIANEFESFDIILDRLLQRKKSLASNTLFPTEQAEIKPDDLFTNIFETPSSKISKSLTFDDVNNLQPLLFESFFSALYSQMGNITYLTPFSNDKGVDVVVISNKKNLLIQVKQSRSQIGINAVQEIVGAKAYYEGIYKEKFSLAIGTNSTLTDSALALAGGNKVEIIGPDFIKKKMEQFNITISDVHSQENKRLPKI